MATGTEPVNVGNIKALNDNFYKGESLSDLREMMGLGGNLGTLEPENGGTGYSDLREFLLDNGLPLKGNVSVTPRGSDDYLIVSTPPSGYTVSDFRFLELRFTETKRISTHNPGSLMFGNVRIRLNPTFDSNSLMIWQDSYGGGIGFGMDGGAASDDAQVHYVVGAKVITEDDVPTGAESIVTAHFYK